MGGYSPSSDQTTPRGPRGHTDMAELAKHVCEPQNAVFVLFTVFHCKVIARRDRILINVYRCFFRFLQFTDQHSVCKS